MNVFAVHKWMLLKIFCVIILIREAGPTFLATNLLILLTFQSIKRLKKQKLVQFSNKLQNLKLNNISFYLAYSSAKKYHR